MLRCLIIGGGAAGFFAAITCAVTHPHTQVILIEAGRNPLTKVKISGGGRCNVTHHCFDPAQLVQFYPRGGKVLRGCFTRFQPKDTVAWFESHGVKLKTESDGRMFPITDDSQTIIDCLMKVARDADVILRTGTPVKSVRREEGYFEVTLKTNEVIPCDRVLIATGSNPSGYRWAKELGHTIETPVPSLFTFNIRDSRLKDLAGVSVDNVSLRLSHSGKIKLEQNGALLITHWGISGPGVLKLSAWGARILQENRYQMPLIINWLPEYNSESLRQEVLKTKEQYSKRKIYRFCPFNLPKRLWQRLLSLTGINEDSPWADLSKKALNQLVQELNQGVYQIEGKGVFKEEFVTCGGVRLKEVDFKTMESKVCPGLFFAGEVLDIDGVTGGFNFQSAWTTAWLAGQNMGKLIS
ncbi:NAD(P)/FAD-dependent oxidoreductase [Gloeothece citriformis]|uniref:NAD(P)/FAD-dependent oxidoreductase n=1 Tax=Gloeothece citriformis TaxID=2546356 RepID=UPI00193D1BCD|nr:NAD(P)/FAD-dependent oxidoreductase [Gloeothece citriformis]